MIYFTTFSRLLAIFFLLSLAVSRPLDDDVINGINPATIRGSVFQIWRKLAPSVCADGLSDFLCFRKHEMTALSSDIHQVTASFVLTLPGDPHRPTTESMPPQTLASPTESVPPTTYRPTHQSLPPHPLQSPTHETSTPHRPTHISGPPPPPPDTTCSKKKPQTTVDVPTPPCSTSTTTISPCSTPSSSMSRSKQTHTVVTYMTTTVLTLTTEVATQTVTENYTIPDTTVTVTYTLPLPGTVGSSSQVVTLTATRKHSSALSKASTMPWSSAVNSVLPVTQNSSLTITWHSNPLSTHPQPSTASHLLSTAISGPLSIFGTASSGMPPKKSLPISSVRWPNSTSASLSLSSGKGTGVASTVVASTPIIISTGSLAVINPTTATIAASTASKVVFVTVTTTVKVL